MVYIYHTTPLSPSLSLLVEAKMDANRVRALVWEARADFEWRMRALQNNHRQMRDTLERIEDKLNQAQTTRNRITALENSLASLHKSHGRYQSRIAILEAQVADQQRDIARFKVDDRFSVHGEN